MLSLPRLMIKASRQLQEEAPWVWLYEIEVPTTPVTRYRFTNNTKTVNYGVNVLGNPISYVPFPVLHGDLRQTSSGDIPQLQIQVGYPSLELRANVDEFNGFVGSPAVIRLVNTQNLNDPSFNIRFDGQVAGAKIPFGANRIVMGLSAFNLLDASMPGFRYTRFHCPFDYGSERCGIDLTNANMVAAFPTCDHSQDGPTGCAAIGVVAAAEGMGSLWPKRFGGWASVEQTAG